jgi:hypothetical protein
MLHGNAQRIPLLGSGGRDIPGWRAEALFADGHREEDSALMRRARTRLQALDEAEFAFIGQIAPARHPLVVGNLVLARTLENLVAFDLRDGRRVWETPAGVLLRRDLLQPFSRELRTRGCSIGPGTIGLPARRAAMASSCSASSPTSLPPPMKTTCSNPLRLSPPTN